MTTDTEPFCCTIGCDKPATFEIFAVRGKVNAGPDPYADVTQACEAHVGALLGWQPDCVDPDGVSWLVYSLPVTPPPLQTGDTDG